MNKILKYTLIGISIFIFLGILMGSTEEQPEKVGENSKAEINTETEKPKTETKTETTPKSSQTETTSNAFKLASLEIGHNNPPKSLVNTFDSLLKKLTKKCSEEDETQIANYIFKTKKMVNEKGGTITLLQAGNGIDKSIPEEATDVVSCAEVAAAFVVLLTSQ